MQPKLLRALQERKVRPVGANQEVPFDSRIVAATNRNLEDEVYEKRFREDLYYRINVVKIDVPPLRERGGDVLHLAQYFLKQFAERNDKSALELSTTAAEKLMAYNWPGNVRELENCMEHAVALARFDQITVEDLPEKIRAYRAERFVVAAERSDRDRHDGRARAPLHPPRPLPGGGQQVARSAGPRLRSAHALPQARALR